MLRIIIEITLALPSMNLIGANVAYVPVFPDKLRSCVLKSFEVFPHQKRSISRRLT